MKPKLTFLISLTFLFLFSGISKAGMFSPDDRNECVFQNMKHAENRLSAVNTYKACRSKFPEKPPKGPSGLFGPENYSDCILKYNKGVTNLAASALIEAACRNKFPPESPEIEKAPEESPEIEKAPEERLGIENDPTSIIENGIITFPKVSD